MSGFISRNLERAAQNNATYIVEAPPGPLGIVFQNTRRGPSVASLTPESPLQLDVGVGWLLLHIGKIETNKFDCSEAAAELEKDSKEPTRMLTFLDPELEKATLLGRANPKPPRDPLIIKAPAGKLGVVFQTMAGGPIIESMRNASPLAMKVAVGWRLLAIDGVDTTRMGANEAVAVLAGKADKPRDLSFDGGPAAAEATLWGWVKKEMRSTASFVAFLGIAAGFVEAKSPGLLQELYKNATKAIRS